MERSLPAFHLILDRRKTGDAGKQRWLGHGDPVEAELRRVFPGNEMPVVSTSINGVLLRRIK